MSADVATDSKHSRLEALKELRQSCGGVDADEDPRLITVAEACEVLQWSRSKFYRRLDRAPLQPIRIDGRAYLAYDEFAEYVRTVALSERTKIDRALRAGKARGKAVRKAEAAA